MKKIYKPLIVIFTFLATFSLQAQVYVNHGATGMNDGTSWENAYTDLSDALNNSTMGDQLWVASGTYKPGGDAPTASSFFTFSHDLELYGGFEGTETLLTERDWATNETILSGDHNDDDADDDFFSNKIDNSEHVMWLTDTVSTSSIIDGFTVRNGRSQDASGSGNNRRGGGILTYGAPTIRNCYFTQNYGYFGGGLYPRGSVDSIVVDNCSFINNYAGWGGAGMYNLADAMVMTNCTFTGNIAETARAGGLYTGVGSTISNCTFTGNTAASSSGGSLQVRSGSDPDDTPIVVNITDCSFMESSATWGGAVGCYDAKSTVNFTDCTFHNNNSENTGGAISNAFGATTNLNNCTFTENVSGSGGAVYSQNDISMVSITDCSFSLNSADVGGAVNISGDNEPSSTDPLPMLSVLNSYFNFNIVEDQGGAINLSNVNASISSSILEGNFTQSTTGIGGGISINTSDTIHSTYSIINSTLVNNSSSIGAGISHWKPGTESTSVLTLQNTILDNPAGNNYEIEDGDPVLESLGGNLSSDMSASSFLIGTNDLNDTDPLFLDPSNEDYHLQDNSPCIDAGISDGAPLTDIEGLPRVGEVDMGSFENQQVTNIRNLKINFGKLTILPNPIQDNLYFNFESNWRGDIMISVTDMNGKEIFFIKDEKTNQVMPGNYSVNKLPKGIYNLTISNGTLINTKSFIKN